MNGVRKLACGIVCLAAFAASSAFAAGSLPSGYTEVEYIESDGNQYIDTLWTNGSGHVVTLDIQPTELPTSNNTSGLGGVRPCYGCRTAYNVKNISFFMDYANSAPAVTVDFNNSNHTPYRLSAGSISADRRYVVVDSAATRSVTGYDSSSNVVTTASDTDNCSDTFTCDGSAYLFAINDMSGGSPAFLWGNKAKVKFFGGTVKTVGGTLCCNFVPCLKNGTEPGVYDTVRDVFLPNSGSGTFTYGAVIGVISYSIPAFFPPSVSDLTATGATVTCELIALGEGATSANVWFTYTDGVATNTVSLGAKDSAPANLSVTLGNLATGIPYSCWFTATNNAATPAGSSSAPADFRTLDSIGNYMQLQYLESSGTQAIDTGVKFGRYTRMSFRMKVTGGATGGQIGVIDSFGTDGKYDRFHFNVNGDKLHVWCDRRDEGIGSVHAVGGTWHNYDINLVDNKVYRDGTQDISAATNPGYVGTTNNHSTIWLFGRNSNTPSLKQYATIYLSKVEIWQDGRETDPDRSLVPCKRLSDNVLGMYDTVKNEFLTNVGTGTFVPGPGSLDYDEIPPQILNDEPVCPEVVVKAGGHRLVKDTDYTLAWMDNTDTGLGKVTVTPIGSYADCAVFAVQFLIVPKEKTLPPEYQRIAYIESTSGGMQQLDTLVPPNGNMRVDIKFQLPIPNAMGQVGMIDDVGSAVERFHMGNGDRIYGGIGNKYSPGFDYSTVVGDNWALMMLRTRLENNVPCGWFVLNETNIDKMTDIGTFRADNTTFGLFGRLSNNNNYKTYAAYRVMYMEVKEGDEQVQTHRFVPCRRVADGELGVYDTVARQFLYDTGREARGADVFLAGPVVGDGWRPGMVIRLY